MLAGYFGLQGEVMAQLKGWPLDKVNSFANSVAAFVCSQKGATPILPKRLVAYQERGDEVVSPQSIPRREYSL